MLEFIPAPFLQEFLGAAPVSVPHRNLKCIFMAHRPVAARLISVIQKHFQNSAVAMSGGYSYSRARIVDDNTSASIQQHTDSLDMPVRRRTDEGYGAV
ncbi:hypothetical protein IFM61606_06670 [Aspergillus udagawae]|uniref:Uncharacterized protein n=1 Tax=Aspergillus udagawae TaxID=91492 RepID=A0ABQ1AUY9_9EURO|nr:hypothetical protein IFM53868_05534 [Aspergillus udagawae]GFG26676.1 hypothetical protein IFM61606_06670 [Aspergillus udagawae]